VGRKRVCGFVLLAGAALACAGGSSQVVKDHGLESMVEPSVVLVHPFAYDPAVVEVDTPLLGEGKVTRAQREDLGRNVANATAEKLVQKLEEAGIAARLASDSADVPLHAVEIKGRFTLIDQGDQAARVTVGMGAGLEKLEAELDVYQVTVDGMRILSEETAEAHGDKMPGMAVGVGAGAATGSVATSVAMGAAEKAIAESLGGLDAAADDMAEQLVESTVDFYRKRGWRADD
jgi:hypothetical protein